MPANTFDDNNSTHDEASRVGVCCARSVRQVARRTNSLSPIQWLAETWFSRDHQKQHRRGKGVHMAPSRKNLGSGPAQQHVRPQVPVIDGERWQQSARCRGLPPEVFFPEELDSRRQRRLQEAAAKQICAGCPVITACREHALRAPEKYGVWGALTARERFTNW